LIEDALESRNRLLSSLQAEDMSLLGRDITDLFAAIVDRPGNFVCLLGQNHRYKIEYLGS